MKMDFWDTKKLFQTLTFYNAFIEKPKIKHLSSIELLRELPFDDVKSSNAFRGYGKSYKVEIVESKDPLVELEASKSSIKDLFSALLVEMKVFKYQITMTILLNKHKNDGYTEYSPVYFNSTTKTVLSSDFSLDKSF